LAQVLVLVSGGVDSSVCAALLHKALGPERVVALHIDHGFMRQVIVSSLKNLLSSIHEQALVSLKKKSHRPGARRRATH